VVVVEAWGSVVGIATCYGLDVVGSNPQISVAQARVFGRSLAGVAVWNFAGGMDVCVVSKEKKGKCRKIKTNKQLWIKYRVQLNTKKISGVGKISCICPDLPWGPSTGYRKIRGGEVVGVWR
jgi:hypothetical protein